MIALGLYRIHALTNIVTALVYGTPGVVNAPAAIVILTVPRRDVTSLAYITILIDDTTILVSGYTRTIATHLSIATLGILKTLRSWVTGYTARASSASAQRAARRSPAAGVSA